MEARVPIPCHLCIGLTGSGKKGEGKERKKTARQTSCGHRNRMRESDRKPKDKTRQKDAQTLISVVSDFAQFTERGKMQLQALGRCQGHQSACHTSMRIWVQIPNTHIGWCWWRRSLGGRERDRRRIPGSLWFSVRPSLKQRWVRTD